jgi:RNA polymerase sigma-70 factor (ECF subfamily)
MQQTSWSGYVVRSQPWVGEMDEEAVSPIANVKSDASLVERARAGDDSAWTAIVELHWRRVWSLSRMVVRDQHGAEEVAQETFRVARERLGAYDGEGTLCAWIQTLCRRRALDELRRRGRQVRSAAAGEDRRAEDDPVERALAALEPEEREAFLLATAGSTPEELASSLGVPAAIARARMARARAGLLDPPDRGGVG